MFQVQETRNKIYAIISGLLGIALVAGLVDQAAQDQILSFTEILLDLGTELIGLIASILAWWKSRPSQVTTVEVPKDMVDTVTLITGESVTQAEAFPSRKDLRDAA